eukprot:1749964-Alexandrium_andersonii.AAC.1
MHGIIWDISPAQAHWRTGRAEVAIKLVKETANKLATEDPSLEPHDFFGWVDQAHAELFRVDGWSPDQILYGRQLRPLDSELGGDL